MRGSLISLLFIALFNAVSSPADIDPRTLIENRGDRKTPHLKTRVGKALVEQLLLANGEHKSTTSCRLENKRVVSEQDLLEEITELRENKHIILEQRETKNLGSSAKAGTFTFYGTALKFEEAPRLPKTSIKMRIRIYILAVDGVVTRSPGFEQRSFLEIKIKNPYPEYPLSVHKYRLILPDEDVLLLIKSNPTRQAQFFDIIETLKLRAHSRDKDKKETNLINTLFEQIAILAIADPNFINPTIGITYYRQARQYKDVYEKDMARYFEITIDEAVKAFHPDFSADENTINIDKYFSSNEKNMYLITAYPDEARVVEFKQPDAIGYDGPGVIKHLRRMNGPQKDLWLAFVGNLTKKTVRGTEKDKGKFSYIKSCIRASEKD